MVSAWRIARARALRKRDGHVPAASDQVMGLLQHRGSRKTVSFSFPLPPTRTGYSQKTSPQGTWENPDPLGPQKAKRVASKQTHEMRKLGTCQIPKAPRFRRCGRRRSKACHGLGKEGRRNELMHLNRDIPGFPLAMFAGWAMFFANLP